MTAIAGPLSDSKNLLKAFLLVAMAYIEPKPMWQRITLVVATVPITIACNVLRVTLTTTAFVWAYSQPAADQYVSAS